MGPDAEMKHERGGMRCAVRDSKGKMSARKSEGGW